MRTWHVGAVSILVLALGTILALLKPRPYVAMTPTGTAVTVASDVPAQATDGPWTPMAQGAGSSARTEAAGGSAPVQAATSLAAPATGPAVTISQDVPTASLPVPENAVRPQDDAGPPPRMEPGNGPPPGPPPEDDDMGPPPGAGPPPGMRPPN